MDDLKIKHIRADMETIAGDWDGDESGSLEDRAHAANDVLEKLKELEELLKELDYIE